jgi:hypothetical protein
MRKSVGQAPTAGEQTQQKPCRTSSDIGEDVESHTVRRGPMYDRKGLMYLKVSGQDFEKYSKPNFMKILPMGAEFFDADDADKDNSRFLQLFGNT